LTAQASAPGSRPGALARSDVKWALVFISPWIVGFVLMTAGPMLASLVLSFTNYDAIPMTRDSFVGLANYEQMLRDPRVVLALNNTIFYTILYVPISIVLGLGLAMLLLRVGRSAGAFRTAFYLPNLTPTVAIGAIFLMIMNGQQGLLNQVLRTFGLSPPSWLNDPNWIKPAIVVMVLWTLGSTVIIFFAALRNVPNELYEAARVDGAGSWARFRNVTFPFISGAIFFVLIIHTIAALQLFDQIWAMFFGRQTTGASERSALFYVVYVFRNAFEFQKMGYATALAWLLFVVIVIITVIQIRTSRRWVYYPGEER
jgi:multiple sugar transport system permease protein